MQAEVVGLRAQTERQDYLIAELRHALYGKRSEQLNPDDRQLAFEDLETAVAEAEAVRDAIAAQNADGTTRRPAAKRNLGHLPDHLPRIEQLIEPARMACPCGCTDMVKIGEDRSERLDIIPARFQVIRCPAAHVYMRARGDDPPQICLPPLRWRRAASRCTGTVDRSGAANRRHISSYRRLQIRRSLAALPPIADLRPCWIRARAKPKQAISGP